MTAAATIAALAYLAMGVLAAATTADRLVTLGVAVIGALASIAAAVISRGNRREIRGRRVVIAKTKDRVTVTNEQLDELENERDGG